MSATDDLVEAAIRSGVGDETVAKLREDAVALIVQVEETRHCLRLAEKELRELRAEHARVLAVLASTAVNIESLARALAHVPAAPPWQRYRDSARAILIFFGRQVVL